MIFLIFAIVVIVVFLAGKRYGARVEKEAVAVALSAFNKTRAALVRGIATAQADAKAEVARLEALGQKYL